MNYFNLPKETIKDINIPKEAIYRNLQLDTKTKEMISSDIERIRLKNIVNYETTNIEKNNDIIHDELNFIFLELRTKGNEHRIIKLLHSFIPRGTIIETSYKEEVMISIPDKTFINNSIKVDELYLTPWFKTSKQELFIKSLDSHNFDKRDIKSFYKSIKTRIKAFKLIEESNIENIDLDENINLIERLRVLDEEIEVLRVKVVKENQLNRRIKLNLELKKKKDEIVKIKVEIKGE